MSEPTNAKRSERAYRLLLIYQQRHDKGEDEETVLTDLLTDILHYAPDYNIDLDRCVEMAKIHYQAELDEANQS